MKKRLVLFIFLILFITAGAVILFYGLNRPIFEVVMDQSWEKIMPKSEIKAFRKSLSQKGIKLVCKVVNPFDILQETAEGFSSCDYVLFSPVASAALESRDIDVKDLTTAVTFAIEVNEDFRGFDVVLPVTDFKVSDYCKGQNCIILENSDFSLLSSKDFEQGSSYITDYRFSLSIPSGCLKGTVCPDLSKSIIPLLESKKGSNGKGELVYGFREVK